MYQPTFSTTPETPMLPSLMLSKEDVKNAALTCCNEIHLKKFDFGFTAENTFYRSNSMEIDHLKFFHDRHKIEILTSTKCSRPLKIEVKYSSFCVLNFIINKTNEIYDVMFTINITHPPLFGTDKPLGNWTKFTRVNPLEDNRDRPYWKSFIRSTAFRLQFNLRPAEMYSFMNQLYQLIPCGVTFTPMKVAVIGRMSLEDLDIKIRTFDWNIRYDVECIKQCGTKGDYFLNNVLFERKNILKLTKTNARELFAAMYDHIQMDPSLSSLEFKKNKVVTDRDIDEDYVLVKTVYVTPTRVVPVKEDWTMDSRGLRFLEIENVIQIKFRDDNLSWFPHDLAIDIVTPTCRNGIYIGNRLFHEFGGSNSLFRECGSYFYAAEDKGQILKKYKQLGEFEPATAAKMSARLGQYFTSALKTRMPLLPRNVRDIDDIKSIAKDAAGNHYCFTDGNEISYVPSAFQIRHDGYKGMLTVAPKDSKKIDSLDYTQLIDNDGHDWALFRKSQKKFHVKGDKERDFDIVQWSTPAPFNLYCMFIAILDYLAYINGKQQIIRDRLRELNNSACFDIIKPLIDNQAFLDKLEKLPTYSPIPKMETKNLMNEQFWRSMVEASVLEDARLLASKTQIPLPPSLGRTAFGIADNMKKLKANQIFFQYSKTLSTKSCKKKPIILTGKVGVTRSPIYHPGDIRFYEAVDIPELHHLFDVVVFPTVGTRPIPDQLGGGDLDGDVFGIFWDKDLILDQNFDATDFADLDSDEKDKISLENLQEKQAKFRSDYLENRVIEHLSNCYLAISLTNDIDSEECKLLRSNADKAVNFSKSGKSGRALKDYEKQISWPVFMGKDHEPGYKTSHILCELNETNNAWFEMIQNASEEAQKQRDEKATTFKMKWDERWKNFFEEYKKQIQVIMTKHQIKNEGELFANAFISTAGTLGKQKLPLVNISGDTSVVQRQIHSIFKAFRSAIFDSLNPSLNWRRDMEDKKEHIVTYKYPNITFQMIELAKMLYGMAEEDKTSYSFPWLLWEGLDAWWSIDEEKLKSLSTVQKIDKDFYEIFGSTTVRIRSILNTNGIAARKHRIERERTPSETFTKMVKTWADLEHLNLNSTVAKTYFQNLQTQNDSVNYTVTGGGVFLSFLTFQMQNNNGNDRHEQLQKAAKSILIKLAFLSESNIFKENILQQQQILEQQCIVVSVPKNWVPEFQQKYCLLKDRSGCDDVAIGVRRTFKDCIKFSVMFRGSMEARQKLKALLIPVINITQSQSMAATKKHIEEQMNQRLMEIFAFTQSLNHSNSAPNQLNNNRGNNQRGRWRRPYNTVPRFN